MANKKKSFKKLYPKLWEAMKANMKLYEVYGIKFWSHTPLTLHEIVRRCEGVSETRFCPMMYDTKERLPIRESFVIRDN